MSEQAQIHQTPHFPSQILSNDQENSININPQQINTSPFKKDNSSQKALKEINQNLFVEQCTKCENEDECCELRRQKTFFCHPDDQINPDCCLQNQIPEILQVEQNLSKDLMKKPLYSGFSKSQFYTTQTFIQHPQTPRKRQISLKQMHRTQENTLLNSKQNDYEKMTQSEQMIEQFERQQLEFEKKLSLRFLQSIKSQQTEHHNQNPDFMDQKIDDFIRTSPRKSVLRQIQQKIKNEKRSPQIKKGGFSLKQFYQNKNTCQKSPIKKLQTEQLIHMILKKVHSQNPPRSNQQILRTQKLVEILTLAIIPQFQRLQNEYKGEMQKIQQKIQQLSKKNSQTHLRDSGMRKSNQRIKTPLNNQSIIRINLNDDFDLKPCFNDNIRDSAILDEIQEQRNEQFQRSENDLIVPSIKRTESQDQLFISCRSQNSV